VMQPTWHSLLRLLRVECAYNYHPLTMVSLWLNSFLFGTGATSFIITNTLLHTINTLLVFVLALKLAKGDKLIAFFTALLWGIHPMHTESVTWVAERKDVLYSLFFFASCIQYVKFTEEGKPKYWIYALALFILSCLAKGMAVVLPLVLVLIDYWYDRKPLSPKHLAQKAPFFIVALLFGALAIHVQGGGDLGGFIERLTNSGESAIKTGFTFGQRFCFGFYAFWIYIAKFFVPIHQHNFYAYPQPSEYGQIQYFIAPVLAIALLVYTTLQYKKNKALFFGVMFFFFSIITVLQFISVGVAIVAERYTYIPYFGLVFMVVFWLRQKMDQRVMSLSLGAVSALFIFLTSLQTRIYNGTDTLFLNSFQYEPKSNAVSEMLSNYYGEKGEFQKALTYGETAVSNGVTSWRQMEVLAKAYYFTGNKTKALEAWNKVMATVPDMYKSSMYGERAMMLRAMGMYQQSADDFDKAIAFMKYRGVKDSLGFKSDMCYEKGLTCRLAGNYPEAVSNFDLCIKLNNAKADSVLKQKALTRMLAKDWPGAINDYSQLISLGLYKDTAYHNRACARFNYGQKDSAIIDMKEALRLNPNYTEARNNLAKML
jgi:tetratricopeptide (TPR) repeat protein